MIIKIKWSRIKEIRIALSMSQEQLSNKIWISRQQIWSYETWKSNMRESVFNDIIRVFEEKLIVIRKIIKKIDKIDKKYFIDNI